MALSIPVTWSDTHRRHAPETAVWIGVPIDADELPERADRIRASLVDAGARVVDAQSHDDAALVAVHDPGLVDFLRTAWEAWHQTELPDDVTRSSFGGSCYLNNAAIAAQYLRDRGASRVALLDVDAHHGNGAQTIFWERDDVPTASVHVDPAEGWFPHFLGFADESGPTNLNVTLEPGAGDEAWLAGVDRLVAAAREHSSEALVVALGVDAAGDDPNSPLEVTEDGFREAGRRVGALGLPTVAVQEGGYVLDTIGPLVRAALEGLDQAL